MSESPKMDEFPSEKLQITSEDVNKVPSTFEVGPEAIPTKEKVVGLIKGIIEKLAKEKLATEGEGEVTFEHCDEQGLYALEVTVRGESVGDTNEYTYVRDGKHSGGFQRIGTGIDITYYGKDGYPCAGPMTNVAEFVNGQWIEVKSLSRRSFLIKYIQPPRQKVL